MKLSQTEEQLMEFIWQSEPVFMKDLLEQLPDPKPAPSTIATLLKRMQEKGYIGFEMWGSNRRYHALVKKEDYFSKEINTMVKDFFNNSALQFASFFTRQANLSEKELKELKQIIDNQIKDKKNE